MPKWVDWWLIVENGPEKKSDHSVSLREFFERFPANASTWTGDHALAALAIGEARRQGIERILSSKRSLEDWREWIYLSLMDKL
jgi:hypothetical protein